MAKYHIGKRGAPAICKANIKNCPLGSPTEHFTTLEQAQQYADKVNLATPLAKKELEEYFDSNRTKEDLEKLANSKSYISRIKAVDFGYRADTLVDDESPRVRQWLVEKGLYTIELQNDKDSNISELAKEKDKEVAKVDRQLIKDVEMISKSKNPELEINKDSKEYDKYRSAYAREKWRNPNTTNEKMNLSLAYKTSLSEGGMSFDLQTNELQRTGMFVSKFPEYSETVSITDYTEERLQKYIDDHKDVFNSTPRAVVGVWHNERTGQVFLDISQRTFDSSYARKLCEDYDQIAFFDTTNFDEVTIDENATSGGVAL